MFVNRDSHSWSDPQTQLWRYIADRTGIIAVSNLPLLFTFAMRNNVLLWMTGWSFATFSKFHRWAARVATVEAIFHSIGYTVEAFLGKWSIDVPVLILQHP
jgi:predicted ferric reductase